MASGGSRNRSGPRADPTSGRSDARGFVLTALPSEGYKQKAPAFPLPRIIRWNVFYVDKVKHREVDQGETDGFRERELEVWVEAWKTPQACAWSMESWRWPILAEYCRLKTVIEAEPDSNAALVGQLHRFRDQLGLTPAGMKENGWAIAKDQVAQQRTAKKTAVKKVAPARRLRSVTK